MTKVTADALREIIDSLYAVFGGYQARLAREPRSREDQAVFEKLFNADVRALAPEALVPLVRIFQLPYYHFGPLQLKHFLPRLCEISVQPLPVLGFPVVAELLGRFDFEQWPAAERTAVWDYLLVFFRTLLEEFSGRRAAPWGVYGYFRELSKATPQVYPTLLSWELTDFVTSLLHLATFARTWVEDWPLRERQFWGRPQTEAIEGWLMTVGRQKLEDAARVHAAEPFSADFQAALLRLSGTDDSARIDICDGTLDPLLHAGECARP